MKNKVFVVSEEHDVNFFIVSQELLELGVDVYRANYLDLSYVDDETDIGFPQKQQVISIWLRWLKSRPSYSVAEEHCTIDRRAAFEGVLLDYYTGIPVVSTPLHNLKARNKLVQLRRAKQYFNVPHWIFSDQIDKILAFYDDNPLGVIYKPLGTSSVKLGGNRMSRGKPTLVPRDVFSNSNGENTTDALFLQERIPAIADIRLIVIGKRVFAVRIDRSTSSLDSRPDWLSNCENYSVVELTKEFEDNVLNFHKELGLNFGASDFLVTEDGKWHFLETNVGGQFLWLQFMLARKYNRLVINLAKEMALLLAQQAPMLVD
jgi:glutathione synthase/RimK-type ligase-like ATP-grasp enzyme